MILIAAAVNLSIASEDTELTELQLDNLEACAYGAEVNPDCPNGCVLGNSGCYCYTWYWYDEAKHR